MLKQLNKKEMEKLITSALELETNEIIKEVLILATNKQKIYEIVVN